MSASCWAVSHFMDRVHDLDLDLDSALIQPSSSRAATSASLQVRLIFCWSGSCSFFSVDLVLSCILEPRSTMLAGGQHWWAGPRLHRQPAISLLFFLYVCNILAINSVYVCCGMRRWSICSTQVLLTLSVLNVMVQFVVHTSGYNVRETIKQAHLYFKWTM